MSATETGGSSRAGAGAAFKDLCIDTSDPARAASFWSAALGLSPTDRGDVWMLTDGVDEHTVWLNPVPEAKTVKHRIHLDVHTAAVADLEALGARVLDPDLPWTVMADPEGGEFCAFVRSPERLPGYRLYELVVDSVDPERIAGWWAERFGVTVREDEADADWFLDDVPGMAGPIVFGAVPEPKTAKNRVHWDLWGATSQFTRAGATLLRARDNEISWDVLADPEGNEFCVFAHE